MILILAILQNSIVRVLPEIYFIPGFTLLDQRLFTNMKSQFAMQKISIVQFLIQLLLGFP